MSDYNIINHDHACAVARMITLKETAPNAPGHINLSYAYLQIQAELTRLREENAELKDLIMKCITDYEGLAEVCGKHSFYQTKQDALETAAHLREALAKHKKGE